MRAIEETELRFRVIRTGRDWIKALFLIYLISFFAIGYNQSLYQIANISFLIYTVASLAYIAQKFHWYIAFDRILIIFLGFLAYTSFTMLWVPDIGESARRLVTVYLLFLLLILICNVFDSRDSDYLIKALWISCTCTILLFYAIYSPEQIITSIGDVYIRLGGELSAINKMARFAAIYVVVCTYYLFFEQKKWMLFFIVLGTIILAATQSRSGMLYVLFAVFSMIISYNRMYGAVKRQNLNIIILLLILAGIAFFALNPELAHRIFRRVFLLFSYLRDTTSLEDYSAYSRVRIAKEGISTFFENPLFGHGIGSGYAILGSGEYYHNNFIQLLVETGIIGTVLYYVGLLRVYRENKNRIRKNKNAVLATALMLAQITGDLFNATYYHKETFIILGICICICKADVERKESKWQTKRSNLGTALLTSHQVHI